MQTSNRYTSNKRTGSENPANPHTTGLVRRDHLERLVLQSAKSDNESRGLSGLFSAYLTDGAIRDRLSRSPDIGPVNSVIKSFAGNADCALDLRTMFGGHAALTAPFLNDPITRYLEYARHIGQRLESADGFVKRRVSDWGFGLMAHANDSILVKLAVQDVSLENPAMTLEKLAATIRP